MGLSMFGFFALSRPAPLQAPQSAHREDDREERGHAHREECPDEEETPAALGPEADSRPSGYSALVGVIFRLRGDI
jgi:hypothetical protein